MVVFLSLLFLRYKILIMFGDIHHDKATYNYPYANIRVLRAIPTIFNNYL